jgi:hypothetical protein
MRRRVPTIVVVLAGALVLVGGGIAAWGELRENRASSLAVKYGAAPSKADATLADRCVGVMREEYDVTDDPRVAGMGPKAFALLTPRICELGMERGLVEDDGTMSEQSGYDLTLAVIEEMGPARFQTLVFDELAVSYRLARPGRVGRWHRCVAMGYSGWDSQPSASELPPRDVFRSAVREACTVGIERGLVPESGAAVSGSAAGAEFQQLLMETLLAARR